VTGDERPQPKGECLLPEGSGCRDDFKGRPWWVLDAYPDKRSNRMEIWLTGPQGTRRLRFAYLPEFYIRAPGNDMDRARRYFSDGRLYDCEMVERRLSLASGKLSRVLKVVPRTLGLHLRAARAADFFGGYGRFRFYNLDIDIGQRFLLEQGLFPLARIMEPFPDPGPVADGAAQGAKGPGWNVVDNQLSIHYPAPKLGVAQLGISVGKRGMLPSFDDPLESAELCGQRFFGPEEDMLKELLRTLESKDPDVIITQGGDSFVLPYLYHRAGISGIGDFHLGRKGQARGPSRKEKSYFTYGRIMHRPAAYYLRGRLHIDAASSFLYQEGALDGILELSRMSGITFQRMARSSPGTAISAMEVNLVLKEGGLVAWKKNQPEDFKSLRRLLSADRGGFIYEPDVGLHEKVLEVDFASMYPHIMVIHNISPETLNCDCCGPMDADGGSRQSAAGSRDGCRESGPSATECRLGEEDLGGVERSSGIGTNETDSGYRPDCRLPTAVPAADLPSPDCRSPPSRPPDRPTARLPPSSVPVIGYWTCARRMGLIPRVLEPIVKRRMELKRLRKRRGDRWDRRVSCLKPLLVTAFGYTGYRNAPFGRIECHEAINSYAREILMESSRIAERRGFDVVHGIVDSLWLKGPLEKRVGLVEEISRASGIPLGIEGIYKWLVFLPGKLTGAGALNRYFGLFDNGEFKLRGIALRKHDTPEIVRSLQSGMLEAFSKAGGAQEFLERIPEALEVLGNFSRRVLGGECSPDELILTKRVSRTLEEYVQFNDTRCALQRLKGAGLTVPAGESVRYVVTDGDARDPAKRTVPVQFFERERDWRYDRGVYYKLLLRAAEEMLSPFGYDMERLDRMARGNDFSQLHLPESLRESAP
jgi:DNA polymerase elongation subunit (family B)